MRDIKFRAWDKQKAEYIDMFLGFTLTDGLLEYLDDIMNEEKNVIIEQYTGIKDANGVKIYENDLVKVISQYWGQLGNVYKVEFYRGAFIARNSLYDMRESINVIGNIHEQPELLEEKWCIKF